MQFAIDKKKNRVHIDEAIEDEEYFCPCCEGSLTQRRGQKNIHHFAHARGTKCSDNWHYEEMSEWHRGWQEKYPVECREVVLEKDGVRHRADVCVNVTVIEFQHSPMSVSEFLDRNEFYTSAGYKLIWLFDETVGRKQGLENINTYLYIQTEKGIVRSDDEYREKYTIDEFVEKSSSGRLGRPRLYHTLHVERRVNDNLEYYGCPINEGGYAPQMREYTRTACDECEYCLDIDPISTDVKCMGRYKDLDIRLVINQDGDNITYVDYDGESRTTTVCPPHKPGKSIIELIYEHRPSVMIVRNLTSGYEFMISNPVSMIHKYNNHVYGRMSKPDGGFSNESKEIFYASKPDWVVIWKK